MTLGVYTDDRCSQISPYEDLTSYINGLYYNYYGNYNQGATVAETYASAIDTWNEKVSSFLLSVYNHYFCSLVFLLCLDFQSGTLTNVVYLLIKSSRR